MDLKHSNIKFLWIWMAMLLAPWTEFFDKLVDKVNILQKENSIFCLICHTKALKISTMSKLF